MILKIPEIPKSAVLYMRRKLLAHGKYNYSDFPWRNSTNLFHCLIVEILLQRTKAEQVIPVYRAFVNIYPDCFALSQASIESVEELIYPLGLKWRAKHLLLLGKSLAAEGGKIPLYLEELEKLPGVGAYSASAFLSLHANKRAAIVDSNIVRFYGRFFGFKTGLESRRDSGLLLLANNITPNRNFRAYNYALIDFTRNICTPRPDHMICPLKLKCGIYNPNMEYLNAKSSTI